MNQQDKTDIERDVYVSLKEHFNALRMEQDRRIDQALQAARVAVDKAEQAQERRLDLLNEFRQQSIDEQAKFAPREIVDDRLGRLELNIARLYGGLVVLGFIGITNLVRIWFG